MEYTQNLNFGHYYVPLKERIQGIKKAGFTGMMMWWGDEFQSLNGNKEDAVRLSKSENLPITLLHSPSTFGNHIWGTKEERLQAVRAYINVLENCDRLGCDSMVLHLTRTPHPYPFTDEGLESLARVCNVAEKLGKTIAIENTRFLEYMDFVFDNLEYDCLKWCYDTGHANCFTKGINVFRKYEFKLVETHLHDNYGGDKLSNDCDKHNLMGDGTVNWMRVRANILEAGLKRVNLESYANSWSKYYHLNMDDFLKLSFTKVMNLMENGIDPREFDQKTIETI